MKKKKTNKKEVIEEDNSMIDEEHLQVPDKFVSDEPEDIIEQPLETKDEVIESVKEEYIDTTPKKGFLANLLEKRRQEKQRNEVLKELSREKKYAEKQKQRAEKKAKKIRFVLEKEKPKVEQPKQQVKVEQIRENPNPERVKTPVEGLPAKLERVEQKLNLLAGIEDEKKEIKEFKLPRKVRKKLKKLAIKNKILVLLLTTNRGMIPMITDIINGYVVINGIPRNCSPDFIFLWKGKYPAIVLPDWDLNPIGTKDYYDAVTDKRVADPVATVIRMLQDQDKLTKKTFSMGIWIWVGLGAIAVAWVIFGGSK